MAQWNDEEVTQLLGLLAKGLSARQIGMALHKSRNAVIGKVGRLPKHIIDAIPGRTLRLDVNIQWIERGIKAPRPKVPKMRVRPERKVSQSFGRSKPKGPTMYKWDDTPAVGAKNLTLVELTRCTCRWPLWDAELPEEPRYCGAQVLPKSSYCPTHDKAQFKVYEDSTREPSPSFTATYVLSKA